MVATTLTIVDLGHLTETDRSASSLTVDNSSSGISETLLQEAGLQEQLARVGNGIQLTEAPSDLDARFMLAGPTFQTDSGAAFAVTTAAFGGEATTAVEPTLSGEQVLYERAGVTEWWIADGDTYEQGWTVATPPADGSDLLTVNVRFPGAAPTQVSATTVELTLGDGSRAWYRDLHAFDDAGSVLPASLAVVGSDVLITVDAADAVYPVTIDPIIDSDQKITPPRHASGDQFGEAIARNGTRMAVSARNADESSTDNGRVDIYDWNGTGWDHSAGSVTYPGAGSANFGWDLDIRGDRLVVSAPEDDTNGANAGAVFVYDWNGSSWDLSQSLYACTAVELACDGTATFGFDGAQFGYAVALGVNGDIAIGAPQQGAGAAASDTGVAFVYTPTGAGGVYELQPNHTLMNGSAAGGDRFGESIDMDANEQFVIVGSPGVDTVELADVGEVHLFEYDSDGDLWLSLDTDQGPGLQEGQEYGASVAMGIDSLGNVIAVAGRPFRTRRISDGVGTGGVRVMKASSSGLATVGLGDITSPVADDGFGFSVAFDQDYVVVGAPFNAGTGPERGVAQAYLYNAASSVMDNGGSGASAVPQGQAANFGSPSPTTGDHYGFSVAVGPNAQFLVGAPDRNVESFGRVGVSAGLVFSYTPGNIFSTIFGGERRATVEDQFGYSVAVDGNLMAVGAIGDDEAGSFNGAVLLYERESSTDPWTFNSAVTYPVDAIDRSGLYGHALDLEGNYLAVGSPGGNGRVDVYVHDAGTWSLFGSLLGNPADNGFGNLDFGWDVAITDDGSLLAVGIPGHDGLCGSADCGAVAVYSVVDGEYEQFDIVAKSYGEEDEVRYATSVDMDSVNDSTVRVIAGRFNDGVAIDSWLWIEGEESAIFENNIASNDGIGQSVALDGNRLVGASSSGVSDVVLVADSNGPNTPWITQVITTADLATTTVAPNGIVDIDGDFVVVGRADGAGGEVGVFYNDPVYGWGFPDDIGGFGGPLWSQGPLDRIQPSGRAVTDAIGRAVAVDVVGNDATVVAGAVGDDDRGNNAGAVYSTEIAITPDTPPANKTVLYEAGDNSLGWRVSVDGDWAVVGEPGDNSSPTPGRVHTLENIAGTWTVRYTNIKPGGSNGDEFGYDVAMQGNRYVAISRAGKLALFERATVGDPFFEVDSIDVVLSGAAVVPDSVAIEGDYVTVGVKSLGVLFYKIAGGTLTETFTADRFDAQAGDHFGVDVAMGVVGGSPYAVVGAPRWDDGGDADRGKVYIYDGIDSDGAGGTAPADEISPSELFAGDLFGSAVAADGSRFVVGHPGATATRFGDEDQTVLSDTETGMAYVYDSDGFAGWEETQALESIDFDDHNDIFDLYGSHVAIDGPIIVVGASAAEERNVPWRSGAAYSWTTIDGSTWTEVDTFRAGDDASFDLFGTGLDISGTSVLIGAPQDDNARGKDSGAVYGFTATAPGVVIVDNPNLSFGLDLDSGSPASVVVGATGIEVAAFDRELLEDSADDGTSVGSTAFTQTDIQDSPLSGLPIGSTPLSGLLLDDNSFVANIPLIDVEIEGGWEALLSDANSPLADVPLLDLTLGDVAGDTEAGSALASTPLSGLELDGTPLSGLPLSGLVLGGLPLSGLSTDFDWCGVLAEFLEGGCDPDNVTLIEAQISGAPLSGLPLSGLPLSGLDLTGTPLSGLPLSGLNVEGSPLSGLPLSGLPLSGLDIGGTPLSGLPLSGLVLSGLPLSGLPLSGLEINGSPLSGLPLTNIDITDSPLSGLPLSGLVLENVPLSGLPLSGLSPESLPLSGLPLSGLVLADAPLSGLDIGADWCDVLAELQAGYDCSFAASEADFLDNTTIADLGVNGVPLSGLPLSGLPLSGLTVDGVPLSGLALAELPLSGLPLSGLPLSGLPLSGLPLSGLYPAGSPLSGLNLSELPLSGLDVNGSPLSGLPLSGLDLTNLPLSGLDISDTPLSGLPLSGLPLSGLPLSGLDVNGSPLSGLPLSGLDIGDTPLSGLPLSGLPLSGLGVDCELVDCSIDSLGDAVQNGAIDANVVTLGDLQLHLDGITLGEIANAFVDGTTVQDLLDAVANAAGPLTLADLTNLDGANLGDLPQSILDQIQLGDLEAVLHAITWADLVGTLIDPNTREPIDGSLVLQAFENYISDPELGFTLGDLQYFGESTFGDLLQVEDLTGFNFGDLGSILGLIHINSLIDETDWSATDSTLGDLLAEGDLGDLTLGDLINNFGTLTLGELIGESAGALAGYTIGDLLLLLVGLDPAAFSGLEFTEVEAGQLPEGIVNPVTFVAEIFVDGTDLEKSVDLAVALPSTATYVRGSAVLDALTSESIGASAIDTPAEIEPKIGENTLSWSLSGIVPGVAYTMTFDVLPTVSLGSTSLNGQATIAGTDISVAAFSSVEVVEGLEPNDFPDVTPVDLSADRIYLTYISSETDHDVFSVVVGENDELAIQLSSLTEDLDLVLYGNPTNNSTGSALSGTSDEAAIDPIKDPDQQGADAEPLNDFRRLDEEDSNLQLIDISNSPGTETELLVTEALPAGTYYVHVFGANGATNTEPAALQIQRLNADARPDCAAEGTVTGTIGSPRSAVGTPNTLFLVNQQRLEHFYSATEAGNVMDALDDFADYLLNDPVGSTLGVNPLVLPVDQFGSVQAAYSAWDNDSLCSPESANAVVAAINAEIDPYRADLDNIVMVGGDLIVPMARLSDETEIANEYDFRFEFIGDNLVGGNADDINALSASFWDRMYLSDEPYGETAARDLGDRFLYVSDAALGRLVEEPTEIIGMLSHFQNFDGQLQANTAAVLGYDFLVDSSEQISADLADAGLTVDDEFADGEDESGEKWTKDDAAGRLLPLDDGDPATVGPVSDLISLNGHFDHYRALPANGDKVPGFDDLFLANTVELATPGELTSRIIFSMGCHGGLSVADRWIGDGPDNTNGDWPQTFSADQAIYLGNTGFGYGDTEAVAYTEQLIALFAEQAVRPTDRGAGLKTTIGQALTFAKNEYASDLSVFSVYDEKALMEMTFYGLPFYTVNRSAEAAPPVPENVTAPDSTELETLGVNADAQNTPDGSSPRGVVYSNPDETGDPQVIVSPGYPIQPSLSVDVSVVDPNENTRLEEVAHGAVILSMDSTYVAPVDPVVASVVFQEGDDADREPPLGDVVFPAKPVTINRATTPGGDRQTMVLATGQFSSEGMSQRLDDNINAVVYYAAPGNTDYEKPTVGRVESTLNLAGDQLTVTLDVSDAAGEVLRVYVLFTADPGSGSAVWTGIDLVNTPGTDEWSGSSSVPAGTTEVEFLVQAVDSAGNVGYATNKARNFSDDGVAAPVPPSPDLDVIVDQSNYNAGVDWYTGSVDVTVDSGDLTASYAISPGTPTTEVTGGGFTITGEGVFNWTVTTIDGQVETGQVRIDSLAPVVSVAPPGDGVSYQISDVPNIGFSCLDPSIQTCTATVDGNPIGNGDPLPASLGSHDVVVTGVDVVNAPVTAEATYTVVADPLENLIVSVSTDNFENPPGLYTDDVVVTVDGGGEATEYTLNDGEPVAIPAAGGTFTITDEGVTEWLVSRPSDEASVSGTVEIDRLAPEVTITVPQDVASYPTGSVPAISFVCDDANLATCEASVDGNPIADGDPLPDVVGGPYAVEVTGTDTLGRETTDSVSYSVVPVLGGVAITDVVIDGVAEPGQAVDVEGEFSGGAAPYTLTVDWGDGSDCGAGTCSASGPVGGDPGLFNADYIYPNGGVFSVTVTITDAAGSSATATLQTATCTILGTSRSEVLRGTAGDDVICGLGGNDRIYAGSGNDLVFGGSGRDTIYGQDGDDTLFGGRDNDRVYGQNGNDMHYGGAGIDLIYGGIGDDTIRGGSGNDRIYGQNDNDTLIGDRGADRVYGGNGDDKLFGRSDNDRLYGQNGSDEINGGDGVDLVFGGGGDDDIFGSGGRDNLNGGGGDDMIDGGADTDRCRGNAGTDVLANCEL
ncbi:MAG: hypothetical protein ACRBK7_02510 [Acidimicrobiales bacterium]